MHYMISPTTPQHCTLQKAIGASYSHKNDTNLFRIEFCTQSGTFQSFPTPPRPLLANIQVSPPSQTRKNTSKRTQTRKQTHTHVFAVCLTPPTFPHLPHLDHMCGNQLFALINIHCALPGEFDARFKRVSDTPTDGLKCPPAGPWLQKFFFCRFFFSFFSISHYFFILLVFGSFSAV